MPDQYEKAIFVYYQNGVEPPSRADYLDLNLPGTRGHWVLSTRAKTVRLSPAHSFAVDAVWLKSVPRNEFKTLYHALHNEACAILGHA